MEEGKGEDKEGKMMEAEKDGRREGESEKEREGDDDDEEGGGREEGGREEIFRER